MADKQEKDEENPFSFKHFMKDGQSGKECNIEEETEENPYSFSCLFPERNQIDTEKDTQDSLNFISDEQESDNEEALGGLSLPDLPFDSLTHTSRKQSASPKLVKELSSHETNSNGMPKTSELELSVEYNNKYDDNNSDLEDIFTDSISHSVHSEETSFTDPNLDFLGNFHSENISIPSITSMKGKKLIITDEATDSAADESISSAKLLNQLHELKQQNAVLTKDLNDSKKKVKEKSAKVHKLETKVSALQKKEHEDTAALEEIIQQVEANLKTTTERAVVAEKNAESLKQEIKQLQIRLQKLTVENQRLQLISSSDCEEKITYVSQQLGSAANTAEQNLKQLLDGVGNLKMLSEMLLSVNKFTELPSDDINPGASGGKTN